MGDVKPIKAMLICGLLFFGGLLGVGMLIHAGEDERAADARALQERQREMFDATLDQAREAQKMQRMHMQMMQAEMAAGEGAGYGQDMDDSGFSPDENLESYFSQAELDGLGK